MFAVAAPEFDFIRLVTGLANGIRAEWQRRYVATVIEVIVALMARRVPRFDSWRSLAALASLALAALAKKI